MFMFGADPEIFVKKNGKAVSAHGLIEGTKKSPFKTSRGAVQVDGTALEFNVDPVPANDFETFNANIVATLADLKKMVPGYSFNVAPVQEYPPEYLASIPDEAKALGCDPDFNAYTLKENPMPDMERSFRTGAGHIHIGWGQDIPIDNPDHIKICADFVKTLDMTVGLFMTCIDKDKKRRELYGCAGAFRPKPYGVEYRTPSNAWITTRARRSMVHILLNRAINLQTAGRTSFTQYGIPEEKIVEIINTGDAESAQNLLKGVISHRDSDNFLKIVTSLKD